MKKKLRYLLVLFMALSFEQANAQSFFQSVTDPFGLIESGAQVSPAFADLDGDGDLDLLTGTNAWPNGSQFNYYKNIGNAKVPNYAPVDPDAFGLNRVYIGAFMTPTFVDLDNDGDMDLMVGNQSGESRYFENTGTATAPVFSAPLLNPFGLDYVGYLSSHTFVDLDGDGDLDVLIGEFFGNLFYFENIGTATAPAFGPPQNFPFGLGNVGNVPRPEFIDMDNDGDFDLLVGVENGDFVYFENTGTATTPNFPSPILNSFGLQNTRDIYASPALADLDGDGDLDVLAGGGNTTVFQYYENKAVPSIPVLADGSDDGASTTDNITSVLTPTFTGTAAIGATVYLYDTDGTTQLGSTIATDGTWSITSATLSTGIHTITAKAASTPGHYFSSVTGLTITVSLSPFVTSIVAANTNFTNAANAIYTVTFSKDVTGVSASDFSIVTPGAGVMVSHLNLSKTSNSVYVVTLTGITGDGTLRLDLNAAGTGIEDLNGNQISGGFTTGSLYTFDHTPPTLSEVEISADGYEVINTGHNAFLFFSSSETINTPTVTIAGQPVAVVTLATNQWRAIYTLQNTDPEGVIAYRISFQDLAGNVGTAVTTGTGSITFDKTAPAIPTNFVAISGDQEITLKWDANTEEELDFYEIAWGTDPDNMDEWFYSQSGETTLLHAELTNGTTYYYKIVAYDKAGNPSLESEVISATPKLMQTITFNEIEPRTYGDGTIPLGTLISSANLPITYTATDPSVVIITGNSATILKAGNTDIIATASGDDEYNTAKVLQKLTVNKAVLTIKAKDQERFAGTANPTLTATYTGFVLNEGITALTTLPEITTSAELNSPIGPYDINASGAVATNYSFEYVKGVLTVKPGAPTSITLTPTTLRENQPIGTIAGTLGSTSDDPNATFTYTLASGNGDNDNASFSIVENQIKTAKILDFETKSAYKIRVRSTTNNHLSLDKELTILLSDVNEIPMLATIANQAICYTTAAQTVALTGISAGPETTQTTTLAVSSSNADLFESLTTTATGATTGALAYKVKAGASGTANVTVTVNDNNGTANGGVETYSRTFVITVNAQPVVAINSDKGTQISKGETVYLNATGGASYVWAANNSIENGHNTATIKARPMETTTYTVTATNASGCTESKNLTIIVLDDVAKVKATNIMSPNGDGYNDKWLIDHIDAYPNNEVKVFDKSGRLMYSKKGYDNSWDATLNGAPLAEGTYYYVIDFGPNKPKVKGFITITRPS